MVAEPRLERERDQVFIGKIDGCSCRKSRAEPLIQPNSSTKATPCANAMRKATLSRHYDFFLFDQFSVTPSLNRHQSFSEHFFNLLPGTRVAFELNQNFIESVIVFSKDQVSDCQEAHISAKHQCVVLFILVYAFHEFLWQV